jgi:hypothetical protein
VINLDFDKGVSMSWEGRSCNGKQIEGSSVGVVFYGENGSLLIPSRNSYTIFDLQGKVIKEVKEQQKIDPRDLSNPSEQVDALHIQNMFDAINNGAPLHSGVDSGFKSTLLVQLGNISQVKHSNLPGGFCCGKLLSNPGSLGINGRSGIDHQE